MVLYTLTQIRWQLLWFYFLNYIDVKTLGNIFNGIANGNLWSLITPSLACYVVTNIRFERRCMKMGSVWDWSWPLTFTSQNKRMQKEKKRKREREKGETDRGNRQTK